MIRIIIADDNKTHRENIKTLLKGEKDFEIIGEAKDGYEALKLIQKLKPDAAILDINMPEFSGIQLAQKIKGDLYFIFITGYQDYALKAFDVGSVDYLLKPINPERLAVAIERLRKLVKKKANEHLLIKSRGALIPINIENIIFLEKAPDEKKIIITTTDGDYIVNGTLESFEGKLSPYGHIRSHKSFIINLNKVKKLIPMDKTFIVLLHGTRKEVYISRSYAPIVKEAMKNSKVL